MEPIGVGEAVVRLAVAAVAGIVVGFERERLEKAAGLRTLALVSSGSALFVIAALVVQPGEASRMAAGVATGVGFLGAGAILRDRGEVVGLTTAATVWIAAALGISAATGAYLLTAAGGALTLFVLWVLGLLDLRRLQQDARTYEVVYSGEAWDEVAAARCLADAGLRVALLSITWSARGMKAEWRAVGRRPSHDRGLACLRDSEMVESFRVRA